MIYSLENFINKLDFRKNSVLFLALYYCFSFIFSDFHIPASLGFLLLVIYMVFELIQFIFIDRENVLKQLNDNNKKSIYIMLAIIICLSFLNFKLDVTKIYYILIAITSVIIIFFAKKNDIKIINKLSLIFILMACFFSFLIIFYKLFPNLYSSIIFPLISKESVEYITRTTLQGYSVSVSGEISYTLDIIVIGLVFLVVNWKNLKINKKLYYFIFLVLIIAIFLSQRRAELIGTLLILIIYFMMSSKKIIDIIKKNRKIIILLAIVFILIMVSFIYFIPANFSTNNRLLQTIIDLKSGIDITNGRSALYRVAVNIFKENPIFGIGWMNFSQFANITGNIHVRNVHCIYLQLFTECGVLGGSIFIYLLFNDYYTNIKLAKSDNLIFINVMIETFILVVGLIENTIYTPYFWIVFMIIYFIRTNILLES